MRRRQSWIVISALLVVFLCAPRAIDAQTSFGRNKVQYRTFDFQVLKTEHFDIYYYPEETEAAKLVARLAERWDARLSRFFGHDLRGRQPVILYATASQFQQTNAVEGLIGEGTGGVTEPTRRRVVLPMGGSLADTDHVLGHELVHAFQFDLTGVDPGDAAGGDMPGILDYPLWFVEGMAEYLSLGPVDAQTAMWMRDAALREKLPTLKDLDDPKYFPYRWGHAFWSYVGAKYGDRAVASLIRSAANPRFDLVGLARQLGTDPDTLTDEWHQAILESAHRAGDDLSPVASEPRLLVSHDNGSGRYNVGPEISPDGKQVAFFSERSAFAIDLYLADAESGHIIRRLSSSATDPHFDSLEFLNSAGAWSPDGRTLAITAVRAGRPVLALIETRSGHVAREIPLKGLDDALNPSYSPDGQSVVLSGNAGGLFDLYLLTVSTGALTELTHDAYSDSEPTFTPDGKTIVFVTERFTTNLKTLEAGSLRLARLDLATKDVTPIPVFLTGKHISPQVSADGRTLTFIADPDGISNIYRMPVDGGPVERLSSLPTGVAGITTFSPALSESNSGRLAFSVFENDGHSVYVLDPDKVVALVPPIGSSDAAVLPGRTVPGGDVATYLADSARGLPPQDEVADATKPFKDKLTLQAVGQPVLAGSVSQFGTQFVGGMSALFTDMLGDHALALQAQIGGALADFGGSATYVNRRRRLNWAATAEVSPYSVGYLTQTVNLAAKSTDVDLVVERETSHGVYFGSAYPFNSSTRLELSGGMDYLTFTRDVQSLVYSSSTGDLTGRSTSHAQSAPSLALADASVALVRDTAYFGATAPLFGSRWRTEIDQSVGTLDYSTLILDWRRYFMPVRPLTIAVRALHYARYGVDSEYTQLITLYAGYPEFVHGYGIGSFTAAECQTGTVSTQCTIFDNLIGSRMLIGNIEVRAPLKGLFTGKLEYGRLPVDVAAFFDSGVTWTQATRPDFLGGTRGLVRSVGGAVRVNLFGMIPVELSVAHPLDRVDKSLQVQLGIREAF